LLEANRVYFGHHQEKEFRMPTDPVIGVPLCDLQPQYQALREQIEAAVQRVLASGQVILGPEVAAFEREFADACGASYAIGCASGTDALSLALHALEIGPGDEVIVPPFTFFATVGSVCRTGATPVFADIDPDTFNLDPAQVENKITPRTKAILVVHLFGQTADMEPLWRMAERHSLPIIEDAAQAQGASYQNKPVGTLGSIACFSFYPSKILGTYGDGGMVVTNDAEWAERMRCLRGHGMSPKYYHKYIGWNARLDALQAAILRVKLPHVPRWVAARQAAAMRYDALIEAAHLNHTLQRPVVRPCRSHAFNQYVVRVGGGLRDALAQHLAQARIGYEIYYPLALHLQECLAYLGGQPGDFPAAEEASRCVLALPMFPEIQPEQQQHVIDVCAAFLRRRTRLAA
jgi:dTDP-4-amino-4,6-dideoxygalactose transaminase